MPTITEVITNCSLISLAAIFGCIKEVSQVKMTIFKVQLDRGLVVKRRVF